MITHNRVCVASGIKGLAGLLMQCDTSSLRNAIASWRCSLSEEVCTPRHCACRPEDTASHRLGWKPEAQVLPSKRQRTASRRGLQHAVGA